MRRRPWLALAALLAVIATACIPTLDNTGPSAEEACTSNSSGELVISSPNTVVDRRCHTGTVVFTSTSDGSSLTNSVVEAAPSLDPEPGLPDGVYVEDGATGISITENEIDCNGVGLGSNGIYQGGLGSTVTASDNEIRNCENGITTGANSSFRRNLIRLPDNQTAPGHADGTHADGFQIFAGAHDLLIEWNEVQYSGASSAFQFHTSSGDQNHDIVVRYNRFVGGASALRVPGDNPSCQPPNGTCGPWSGLEVYGNRIQNDVGWLLCTGNPTSIEVWGTEHAPTIDWNNNQTLADDQHGERNVLNSGEVGPASTELAWPNRNGDTAQTCQVAS